MQEKPPQVQALQKAQEVAYEAMYEALNRVWNPEMSSEEFVNHPGYKPAKEAYEKTVTDLVAVLGPDAHCNDVDIDLWSSYSDWFKSENNFRPRFHMTADDVHAAFRAHAAKEAVADATEGVSLSKKGPQ